MNKEKEAIELLTAIGDWFADHPQARKDCKDHVLALDTFVPDGQLLDTVFGEEDDELQLPDDFTFPASEIEVENWGDEEEVGDAIGDYISDIFGYCHYGFDYELDTMDSGEVKQIIVTDIKWDTSD